MCCLTLVSSREPSGVPLQPRVDPENLWYRMAVHHTASGQTTNGSIASKIQGVQYWLMNTQGYCDVAINTLLGMMEPSMKDAPSINTVVLQVGTTTATLQCLLLLL